MSVTVTEIGRMPSGEAVIRYTITNKNGASASFLNYGATWQTMFVPNRKGELVDVVLGYDTVEEYQKNYMYLGCTVGRVANRIKDARFTLNGTEYKLAVNNGDACLHGGNVGFDKKIWQAQIDGDAVFFSLTSPDGDEGFPGTLSVVVIYTLDDENALSIRYLLNSDADTIQNMTNHAYFNLAGQQSSVLDQTLWINASRTTRIDKDVLPTGEIVPVRGTPLDFTKAKPIGRDIKGKGEMVDVIGGYDHNFVIDRKGSEVEKIATAIDPVGGIAMDVYTDQPGVQLFTPPDFTYMTGKNGVQYGIYPAFCLETQHFADAMNHPEFPSIVLHAGEVFSSETVYHFRVEK
ncbi:MAG: galactose-1-epimerase [Firmicutes bacterium HGW-Firmicutes-9]|jgi:aldose 1-epimerase|nr:MAG: galactose-1-epimerase [Firmicutes bacterium HGW-Firmicutes-9]